MPKRPAALAVTHISMHRDDLVVEFNDFKLILTPHIIEHSRPPVKDYSYVEEARLIDYHRLVTYVRFEDGGRRGEIQHLAHGQSQLALSSYWTAAADHICGTDLPAEIRQIIIVGEPMLKALTSERFHRAPGSRQANPIQRVARALSASRRIAH